MPANRRIAVSLLALLALAVLAISACGGASDSTSKSGSAEVAEGEPVTVGGLRFEVTARFLDPNNEKDATYIAGQPPPGGGTRYAGVFVEVENEGDRPGSFPAMSVTDAAGTEHAAYPPGNNPYLRQFGEAVEPHETQPARDSTQGPPVRSLLLFKLTPGSERRPFTLHIESEEKEAKVTLGL